MTDKIFLSYAAQGCHFAEALKPQINEWLQQQAQTLEFFDAHALADGEDFRKAIRDAMDAASAVVLVASPAGEASQWVNYAAGLADALGKEVVVAGRKGATASSAFARLFARFVEVDEQAS